jgi:protein-S-isoprenylcysteine O-methyltransferase Ste14
MKTLEHKIPPPLVWLFFAITMRGVAQFTSAFDMANSVRFVLMITFFLIGLAVTLPAIMAFRRAKTTVDPIHIEKASTLMTTGIYQHSRNPMYLGLTALLLAWASYLAAPWAILGPVLFVLFITRFQIMPEERVMRAKFGSAYETYCKNVRRWI